MQYLIYQTEFHGNTEFFKFHGKPFSWKYMEKPYKIPWKKTYMEFHEIP